MFFGEGKIGPMREMILADTRRSPQRPPGQASAAPAGGLRRNLRGDGRPAGDHPHHRSAAARVPAARGSGAAGARRSRWASPTRRCASASRACTNSIRCSASAAAAWASSIPEITEMQARAIFEAAANVQEKRHQGRARGHDPAGRQREGAREPGEDRPRACRGGHEGEGRRSSSTWSAR